MLRNAGARATGRDFSKEMLAHAARNAPAADLRQGDAGTLPFDDDAFDQVVGNFGMMHLPDQRKALSEVRRVLRPDGRFLMVTWAAPDASPAFGTVFAAFAGGYEIPDPATSPTCSVAALKSLGLMPGLLRIFATQV